MMLFKMESQQKEQTLDFLITNVSDYLFTNNWESDEAELNCIDFLSKLQLQREVLQILSGKTKLADVQASIRSFSVKNQYPVGMR
jgi:transposase